MQRTDAQHPWWIISLALACTSCFVDTDAPCDRGRVELNGGISGCICAPGSVPDPDNKSCSPCAGEHEQALNGSCQCVAGYARAGGVCAPVVDSGAATGDAAAAAAPSGLGTSCAAQSDCASFQADYCIPFPPRTCVVRNCATGEHACPSDLVCCDVSGASAIFPELTMAKGVCVSTAGCAMGGKVVTP